MKEGPTGGPTGGPASSPAGGTAVQATNRAIEGGPRRLNGWRYLLSRATGLVKALSGLLNRHRWLRLGLQIGVLLACLAYLALNLRDTGDLLAGLRPDWARLLAAWVLTTAAVYLGALTWWFILLGLGLQAGLLPSLRVHLQSNLVKYLPGYAWQLVGKAYLSRQMGLPAGQIGVAMGVELAHLVGVGGLLAAGLFPESLLSYWIGSAGLVEQLSSLRWIALLLLAVLVLIVPAGLEALRRRGSKKLAGLRPAWFVASLSAVLAGWVLFGLAFWLLGAALAPLPESTLGLFIFTLASSILLGLAVLFVPGGLGVRESAMVFLLSISGLPPAVAVVAAALSRLAVLLAELAGAFFLETGLRLGKK